MIDCPALVKDALRDGTTKKNYRFVVYDNETELFSIDNDNLISESVTIDEKMCSGSELKFGLCEGSTLTFQYFNSEFHEYGNITGKRIKAFIDVEYIANNEKKEYSFDYPYGNLLGISGKAGTKIKFTLNDTDRGFDLTIIGGTYKTYQVTETQTIEFNTDFTDLMVDLIGNTSTFTAEIQGKVVLNSSLPLGYYDVKECSRQASTGIIKAICYNKLLSDYLDQKANDLIIEAFSNPMHPISFYDIRNVLLADYEINMAQPDARIILGRGGGVGRIYIASGALNLVKSGVNSPLSYYEYGVGSKTKTTRCYLGTVASENTAPLDQNKVYIVRSDLNKLEELEIAYFDACKRMLSHNFVEGDEYAIYQQFIKPRGDYLGWHGFFGVGLQKPDGSIEYYSTIAYNNSLPKVVGTIKDLENKTLLGYTKIFVNIPFQLSLYTSTNIETASYLGVGFTTETGTARAYKYFVDSDLTQTANDSFIFKTPNGDWVSYEYTYTTEVAPYEVVSLTNADLIQIIPNELPDITLREAISSVYELSAEFGKLDRNTDLFGAASLNGTRLLPAETLYPSDTLYPLDNAEHTNPSMYSQLWADEGNIRTFRYLIVTYKGLDDTEKEVEKVLQRTVNTNGTDDYNMSDNWLFKNLIWTDADIEKYADAMVEKMQNVSWFPFEMWCAGLPYLETGDEIEVTAGNETYTTYILQRTLEGIQNLQDTFINGTLNIF